MAHTKSRKHMFGRGSGGGVNLALIITPFLDVAFQLLAFFIMSYQPPVHVGYVEGSLVLPNKAPVKKKEVKSKDSKDGKSIDSKEVKETKEDKQAEDSDPDDARDPDKEKPKNVVQVVVRAVKKGQVENGRQDGEPTYIELELETTDLEFKLELKALKLERFLNGDVKKVSTEELAEIANGVKKDMRMNDKSEAGKRAEIDRQIRLRALQNELDTDLKKILKLLKAKGESAELTLRVDGNLKHRYWMAFFDTCTRAGYKIRFERPRAD